MKRAFTLVELIVVVAIMGVMMGVVGFSISMIARTNVKKTAQMVRTGIEATRVNAMSRVGESSVRFYVNVEKGTIDMEVTEGGSREIREIGYVNTVTIRCSTAETPGDDDWTDIADMVNAEGKEGLIITFDRSTGAFKGEMIPKKIEISGGTKKFTITCYQLTGKSVME